MSEKITIEDVAKRSGVSIATVSRIINKKNDGYNSETKKRVMEAVRHYNYSPNPIARSMITKKTNMVGVIIPDIRNPFYPNISRGIEAVAQELGMNVLLLNSDLMDEKANSHIETCVNLNVDGIIITSQQVTNVGIEYINKFNLPLLRLGTVDGIGEFNIVDTDMYLGGYLATEHLIRLGHTKIACIDSGVSKLSRLSRTEGYLGALRDNNIPVNENLIVSGDSSEHSGWVGMNHLLDSKEEFTAVYIQNDIMALNAYQAIKKAGLSIPKDISVVGFDDISFCEMSDPPLTTIRQPTYEMGREAMKMLKFLIDNPGEKIRKKTFTPELIVRSSTKKI